MGIPGGFGKDFSLLHAAWPAALICFHRMCPHLGFDLCYTYVYYMAHCSKDTSTVKFLVAATCCRVQSLQVTNYGVPTSLEYIVWSFPNIPPPQASALVNLLVIVVVQFVFAYKIYRFCPHKVRWLVTVPSGSLVIFPQDLAWVHRSQDEHPYGDLGNSLQRYYSVTPSAATVVAAEVVITVSLCVLLYDGGSYSPFPRAKRLVNTLIIYAVNRCLLALLVSLGVLAVNVDQQSSWTMGLDLIVGKLYTNSLLASLNAREYLESQSSTATPTLNLSALHSADPPTLAEDVGSSKHGERRFDVHEPANIDITTEPVSDMATTLRTVAEV
ncbi:hypothetical protein EV401DRAFT_2121459 [Pisolithus croceorrhizus]|nr:hypothetical protein EV401DRAFT_2121459 [Pisolithus croceorrhizus]